SRIREVLQVEVALRTLFEKPTAAGLAEVVTSQQQAGRQLEGPSMGAARPEGKLPLSYAQQRLWFIQQLEPESIAYNLPLTVRLKGAVDVSAMRQSLGEVARRHEVLRTRFEVKEGHPVQVIDEPGEIAFLFWDFSGLRQGDAEQQARGVVAQ